MYEHIVMPSFRYIILETNIVSYISINNYILGVKK